MISQQTSEKGQSAGTRFKGHLNPRQRILVVDDDPDIRRFNMEILARAGYHVEVAADGAFAWEMLQLNDYDLLLTDHKMPKVTGIELLIKLHAAGMVMPVIMVSGTMPTNELNGHPGLQIDATLLKPYTSAELLDAVSKVLQTTGGSRPSLPPVGIIKPANN